MSAYPSDRDDWDCEDWERYAFSRDHDWDDDDWIDPQVEFDLDYYGIPWGVVRRTAFWTITLLTLLRFGLPLITWVWDLLRYVVPGAGAPLL